MYIKQKNINEKYTLATFLYPLTNNYKLSRAYSIKFMGAPLQG
jgi:hypothetical protein